MHTKSPLVLAGFVFLVLVRLCPNAIAQSDFQWISIRMGNQWDITINSSGWGSVTWGSERVRNIEGPFAFQVWEAVCLDAIAVSTKPPDAGSIREEFSVVLMETGQQIGRVKLATLTPELKSCVDRILESPDLRADFRELTNRIPLFSAVALRSLAEGTNLPAVRASNLPNLPFVVVRHPFIEISQPDAREPLPKVRAQPERVADSGSATEAKDSSLGFRGWLVICLLAIAAFLTYRFIRLRLGS